MLPVIKLLVIVGALALVIRIPLVLPPVIVKPVRMVDVVSLLLKVTTGPL
jgi:hypothetical protein